MKTEHQTENEKMLIYIPKHLAKRLREEATKNYRSISGEVAYILAQYLAQYEQKEPLSP